MSNLSDNLLSALQGASNAAASNVSGPVDALAWALRKVGVPVPSNAFGGSEWMRQQGLTADPRNRLAGLLGEGVGLAAPFAIAAKAPQIAGGLLKADDALTAGANRMADHFERTGAAYRYDPRQRGAIVYHGSPHKFDKFDSSKIGTGEGAQAYGHGLYLAESPGVAKSYQDALSGVNSLTAGNRSLNQDSIASRLSKIFGGDGSNFTRNERNISDIAKKMAVRTEDIADGGKAFVFKDGSHYIEGGGGIWWDVADGSWTPKGNLYKVDLPDEKIARMLDWDKPLSQQAPEARKAIEAFAKKHGALYPDLLKAIQRDEPGKYFYQGLGRNQLDATSRWLAEEGIPGIRYLDGGSRGAGAGTSNYVVFPGEEAALNILERNGAPINALVAALKGPR